ncbi:hypothetical protein [Candidatus Deianiraea vastatrix]|uniref:AsmA-like C-terminal domain-containing protein n=1 Tax=Candidatus Deianiraea vastatrix TaxID=2163644 RepID=A0A5B8XG86_9RICK|nr:hypothetical protein [Candidatus Deianiraea vastatrix]QED22967.1 hypothetical protein Deia_00157 [Candidatus Deianiraea vastatrix]
MIFYKSIIFFSKLLLPLITLSYLIISSLFLYFSSLDLNSKIKIINNIKDKFFSNKVNFNIKDINTFNDRIYVKLANLSVLLNEDLKISAPNIEFYISPYSIFKLQNPVHFSKLEYAKIEIPLSKLNFNIDKVPSNQNKSNVDVKKYTYNIIQNSTIFLRKLIQKGIQVSKIEIFITGCSKIKKTTLENFTIQPFWQNFHRGFEINYTIKFNEVGQISNKSRCIIGYDYRLQKCDTRLEVKNLHSMYQEIRHLFSLKNNAPMVENLSIFAQFNLEKDINIDKFSININKSKIHNDAISKNIDKFSLNGSFIDNLLNLHYFYLKIDDFVAETVKNTNITIDENFTIFGNIGMNFVNFSSEIFKYLWPDDIGKNIKDFLIFNKSGIKNGNMKIDFPKNDKWIANIDVQNVDFLLQNILDTAKSDYIKIEIDKNSTKIQADNLEALGMIAKNTAVEVGYTDEMKINIKSDKINGKILDTATKLHQVDESFYNFIPDVIKSIFGKNVNNDKTQFLFSNIAFSMPLIVKSPIDFYKQSQFSGNIKINSENIQYFRGDAEKIDLRILKKKGGDKFSISARNLPDLKINLFKNKERIKNFDLNFSVNNGNIAMLGTLNFPSDIVNFDIQGDTLFSKLFVKIDSGELLNLVINAKNNMRDIKVFFNGFNLNLTDFIKHYPDLTFVESSEKISDIDFNLIIKDSIALNNVLLKNANIAIQTSSSYNISEIKTRILACGEKSCDDIFTSQNGNNVTLIADSMSNIINAFTEKKDLIYINDITGKILLNPNISTFEIKTGKINLQMPMDQSFSSSIFKIITPNYSINKKTLGYINSITQGKFFWSENDAILNIDNFYAKSSVSRISSRGYYDLSKEFIDLQGAIDTAYRINKIITAENIPMLNKILTLGSKDGGYGVINYSLKSKISDINSNSLKISGNRGNLILAGSLATVNPFAAIFLVLGSGEVKDIATKKRG